MMKFLQWVILGSTWLLTTTHATQTNLVLDPTPQLSARSSRVIIQEGSENATGGSGITSSALRESSPGIDYPAIAEALRAGCAAAQTTTPIHFPTAVIYLDTFVVIRGGPQVNWLPPKPSNPDATIAGVDADGDCVRDDIEYYIAEKYGAKSQYKLRKYLYEYTAWMDRFLISNLSENTAKTSFNNMAAAGECVKRIIGSSASTKAISDLFAKFHNTFPRSYRYLDNLPRLGGWTTRENDTVSCP